MKTVRLLLLAFAMSSFGTSGWAAQPDQHAGQHPTGAASAPVSKPMPDKASADIVKMDTQTKAMQFMHDKAMNAKSPEERNALMGEHMKTMQDGMVMMNRAAPDAMGSMRGGMKDDMVMQHQMMQKRMDMMAASMQMLMDRLPAVPAK